MLPLIRLVQTVTKPAAVNPAAILFYFSLSFLHELFLLSSSISNDYCICFHLRNVGSVFTGVNLQILKW